MTIKGTHQTEIRVLRGVVAQLAARVQLMMGGWGDYLPSHIGVMAPIGCGKPSASDLDALRLPSTTLA
jgi:hypothetical protein